MKVLLIYATYSSGTEVASGVVGDILSKDHELTIKKLPEASPADLQNFDVIIMASPSWEHEKEQGYPHEFWLKFIEKAGEMTLPGKKFAIFGLGDTAYPKFTGAVDHLEAFVKKLGGTLLIESMRIDGFFFDQENNETKLRDWAARLDNILKTSV